jgi:transposase-like protein
MAGMPKHYPVEQRERAVKMVLDHLQEYRSVYVACQSIGPKVGVGTESLRRWVLQARSTPRSGPVSHGIASRIENPQPRPTRSAAAGCMFQL